MKKIILTTLVLLLVISVYSQPITSPQIDSLVNLTMKVFNVPGIAVAVVKDDKVIHLKGYGVSSIATGKKTDETPFLPLPPTPRPSRRLRWASLSMKEN